MQISTRHFGVINFCKEDIIEFDEGLPGFKNVRKFIMININLNDGQEDNSPLKWLQCIDDPALAFPVVNPFVFKPDYDIELDNKIAALLGIEKETDVELYAIAVVPEDIKRMSINLRAPLVINVRNRKGMQVILDSDKYSIRHYILGETA